jgi:uncharacterized circularly permuted ATP-grasp superfamily protein
MARTLSIYAPERFYDEALFPDGTPRPGYERPLEQIAADPAAAEEIAARTARGLGARFGSGEDAEPFFVDPVPRIITAAERDTLTRGATQRALALNRLLLDAYGPREAVAAGVVPQEAIDGADYLEETMEGVDLGYPHAPVIGIDVVRNADGGFEVLEDNARTPSGFAYGVAARQVSEAVLGEVPPEVESLAGVFDALGETLRSAAPEGVSDPRVVLLSNGPENGAWYEHERVAEILGIEIVTPRELRLAEGRLRTAEGKRVDVVYRRTDEDRFVDEDGEPTVLGRLLLDPLRAGAVGVVNAPGAGLADDKLIHAYVDDLVRFYLGEEPVIPSVRTHDLTRDGKAGEVRERVDELVVKPRSASGGKGIVIGPKASESKLEGAAERLEDNPDDTVAQEVVALSTHPTVCDGRLEPRHVDLRVFALVRGDEVTVVVGGLTRVALEAGSMIVNSSKGGGAKDTWVLRA